MANEKCTIAFLDTELYGVKTKNIVLIYKVSTTVLLCSGRLVGALNIEDVIIFGRYFKCNFQLYVHE